jgi:hypothetical protein
MDKTVKTAIHDCRTHFLRAAAGHPKIRLGETLKERVFEPSKELWVSLALPGSQVKISEWTREQLIACDTWEHERSQMIRKWSAYHNLNFEWVRRAALDALLFGSWSAKPFGAISGYRPSDLAWLPWFFEFESEPTYRKEMKAYFQKALETHIRDVKRERGRLLPDRGSRRIHYSWAAERVCLGWKWNEIANAYPQSVSWQAVRIAVKGILVNIDIPDVQSKGPKRSAS